MTSYYQVLGVDPTATTGEIKKAYRRLALQYHPDHHPGDRIKEAKFKEVGTAYEILSSPAKRALHDAGLSRARHAAEAARRRAAGLVVEMPTHQSAVGAGVAAGVGVVAFGGFLAWIFAGGKKYDPRVDRYRGRDGRFRRG